MKRFVIAAILFTAAAVNAQAASTTSPQATDTYGSLSAEGRKLTDAVIRPGADPRDYCAKPPEQKRSEAVAKAQNMARDREFSSAQVSSAVGELLKYATAVCTSN